MNPTQTSPFGEPVAAGDGVEAEEGDGAAARRPRRGGSGRRPAPPSPLTRDLQRWSRWVHVYTSMTALLVVLFFGATGITLNHPAWTFGDDLETSSYNGTLPFSPTGPDGNVDFLSASEFARKTYGIKGEVDSFDVVSGKGTIAYRDPGYSAELFFDVQTGTYDVTIEQQGWVAVLNDLHKGRDTGDGWRWVIDVSAGFLVVISLTGLGLQLVLRKRRRSALIAAGLGALVIVLLIAVTIR